MTVFAVIALAGFVLFWFYPQLGAAVFLPALGAYLGSRKAANDGASQPKTILWGFLFLLVAIAASIRFLVPEENFNEFESSPGNTFLLWGYLGVLSLAFPIFGYLAYLQRVGRK
jgi:hypothetical protein